LLLHHLRKVNGLKIVCRFENSKTERELIFTGKFNVLAGS
jgi:hypothetical protein